MKKILLLSVALTLVIVTNAQVLLSSKPKDTVAEKSAMLEVKSADRGVLLPRLSSAKRRAIKNPAPGLVVFDTTKQLFYGYVKNTGWRPFLMGYDTVPVYDGESPTVTDNLAGDNMGYCVAINGNIAVAGAPFDGINGKNNQGSLYVFRNDGENWKQVQKVTSPDGAANDYFATWAAMTEDYVFVASGQSDINGNANQGAVYIYKIQDDSLIYHQKITGSSAAANDRFGESISASGNDLFAGANYDDIGANEDQGSLYYFTLENGMWVEKQKIIQDSAAGAHDYFGYAVSIDGNQASVGAHFDVSGNYGYSQNAIFIYEKVNGLWQRRQKINQPDQPGASQKTDAFGYSSHLKGNNLLVGAWLRNEPDDNKDRGVIYRFHKAGNTWVYDNKFYPVDVNPSDIYGDYFGHIIKADGNFMISGSGYEDLADGSIDKGAVYLYEWSNNAWVQKRKIISPTPTQTDLFGHKYDINNGTIIISASSADGGKGKIYFYSVED